MPNKLLAYELWKELEASTQSLDAASLRAGKMDSALETFKEMRLYTPPDIITFNTLVHGFATQGDIVKARAIIDKAKYEGLTLDVMTYSPYLLALAREGAAREARSVIEEMWGAGPPPNAWCYAALVEAHARADGDMMRAEAVAEEMESRAGLPPSTVVFNLLIQGHLKRGEVGKAKVAELLKKMTDLGVPLGVDTYCLLMNSAAESGEEGAVKHVQGLLRSVRARGLAPDAVQASTLSKVLVRQGQAKEALQAASECSLIGNDLVILNQMVHLYSSNGQMTEAEQAAAHAAAAAASSGRSPPVEAYGALIRGYYRLKDLPPLVAAFRSFLRMGGKPNRKMANAVVRLSLLEGQLNIALQAIRVMKLLDVDMDTEQYRSWVMQLQRRQQSTQQRSTGSDSFSSSRQAVGGGRGLSLESMMRDSLSSTRGRFTQRPREQGPPLINMSMPSSESSARDFQGYQDSHDSSSAGSTGDGLERLKWFLGLPNNYYESSWK
ncbi:hypothetical protein CEUSTIGMA_g11183.t1 [Chlamydomonas eustigma]|uniref:PROP1-like PPR domain-containing protein n=1 Tax=Chlamydomonas eustigma TaxID=1157962 RepID=A0A250XL01_9CHLO|nr:hypothetical protein CEUSTIGMA_g11183.t1 [Chlamydomonas eustigma]|eukprot:GAX83758.1 hypothetical protein CEUSTIGMA_g11183.t1 [Chlamydomonas eustigma]